MISINYLDHYVQYIIDNNQHIIMLGELHLNSKCDKDLMIMDVQDLIVRIIDRYNAALFSEFPLGYREFTHDNHIWVDIRKTFVNLNNALSIKLYASRKYRIGYSLTRDEEDRIHAIKTLDDFNDIVLGNMFLSFDFHRYSEIDHYKELEQNYYTTFYGKYADFRSSKDTYFFQWFLRNKESIISNKDTTAMSLDEWENSCFTQSYIQDYYVLLQVICSSLQTCLYWCGSFHSDENMSNILKDMQWAKKKVEYRGVLNCTKVDIPNNLPINTETTINPSCFPRQIQTHWTPPQRIQIQQTPLWFSVSPIFQRCVIL